MVSSKTCGVCKMLKQSKAINISDVANEFASQGYDFTLCYLDAEDDMDFARKYNVCDVPTVLVFRDDENLIGRVDKCTSLSRIKEAFSLMSLNDEDNKNVSQ